MKKGALARFFGVIIVIIAVFAFTVGRLAGNIRQGLDLQGGTHIVMQAEDTPQNKVTNEAIGQVINIMQKRINEMGLTEPIIQREGGNRIIIELPGEKDPKKAIETIGKTAVLEFKDEDGNVKLTGEDLKNAKEQVGQNKSPLVALEFTENGATKFANLTAANIGRHIGIYLDGEMLTNPVVNEAITGGSAVISGQRTLEEAKDLAILLRSGALPVKMSVLEVRTVGPSLGQDSKDKSVTAFTIGLSLIVLFMLCMYRVAGFVANVALLVYVLILLGILSLLNATLTLPSIAGVILSIGMAVDANILIFERFKEEIESGKVLRMAIHSGFKRAFTTIFDANMTVIITSCILFFLGSGTVKGFAFSLGLGVAISMFTAITVSRTLLMMLIDASWIHNPWWFGGKRGYEK
ncbi:protein translocase subunit SecD [Dialister micraerophilus]|uniref:protein translocase subunit SecD n=1 Tax=Dialister micraerophilus TaxID=309120 RepID=UPI001FDFDC20|nr:protein translocase subunit SecD [Dialister micraerophilus]MDK8253784.1 protein translocase subunit SecD [Dialister micraerophilus]MDK8285172.1 protein translocase subunit SecD [Dialister micraerophilus]